VSTTVIRKFIHEVWVVSDPMSSAVAHVTMDESVDALEDAGYTVRYQQVVLDGPNGEVAEVNVEPA
jgi:hypothetical protein